MNFKKILTGALYEKKKKKNDTAKNVAIGAGIGTALGLAAGFLFAPKSGKETRETIAKGAQKLSEEVKEKIEEASSKIKEMTSKKAGNDGSGNDSSDCCCECVDSECEPDCCDDICSCENGDDNINKQ
jgi:hypothetical protein